MSHSELNELVAALQAENTELREDIALSACELAVGRRFPTYAT